MFRFRLLLFLFYLICAVAQGADLSKSEETKILSIIQKYHVQPPQFNNDFSENVFLNFFAKIDPDQLFFDSTDIIKLEDFKFSLFETPDTLTIFNNTIKTLYQKRIHEFDSICSIVLQKKLDFQTNQYIKINNVDNWTIKNYYNNHSLYIEKWLKFKVLQQIQLMAEIQDTLGLSSQSVFKYEEAARKKVIQLEKKKVNTLLKSENDLEVYLSTSFKRAIMISLDPHSNYLSAQEKSSFEASLSPSQLSYGFQVSINEVGELVVLGIVPGSSAWKSNKLHKGDVITSIIVSDKNILNISDADIKEIEDVILSPNTLNLGFTIRRKDGQIETIHLDKTKIRQDESNVRSFILNGKNKIGYIILPDFYTEFENNYEYGCSNDVAKAIIKLKKENIQGLIIDLRDNGGGSVREAVDLSGIFIDYGPICTVVDNGGKAFTYKDFNRGLIYSGPLLIMVNKQSASASELFASAMQDYNRAVIIGSPTYGKATSQIILPCDSDALRKGKITDYLKLTVQTIYRINNKSNQRKGIVPDIILPDILDSFPLGENNESLALQVGTINKKVLFTPLKELPIQSIKEQSRLRVKENNTFTNIINLSDSVYRLYYCGNNNVSLNIQTFSYVERRKKKYMTMLKQLFETTKTEYSVKSNDLELVSESDSTFNFITKDIYIQEAYNVMKDLSISIKP
jgi:carboxyl-terminal processing protease